MSAPLSVTDTSCVASDEAISTTVVRCVAVLSDTPATELPPIETAIDTEALDALYAPERERLPRVQFEYLGYSVSIADDRAITVGWRGNP